MNYIVPSYGNADNLIVSRRDPTASDAGYPVGTHWINIINSKCYILTKPTSPICWALSASKEDIIEADVEFGSGALSNDAELVISYPDISFNNNIICEFVDGIYTSKYECFVSEMTVTSCNVVPGVGFTIAVHAPEGCSDTVKIKITIS